LKFLHLVQQVLECTACQPMLQTKNATNKVTLSKDGERYMGIANQYIGMIMDNIHIIPTYAFSNFV